MPKTSESPATARSAGAFGGTTVRRSRGHPEADADLRLTATSQATPDSRGPPRERVASPQTCPRLTPPCPRLERLIAQADEPPPEPDNPPPLVRTCLVSQRLRRDVAKVKALAHSTMRSEHLYLMLRSTHQSGTSDGLLTTPTSPGSRSCSAPPTAPSGSAPPAVHRWREAPLASLPIAPVLAAGRCRRISGDRCGSVDRRREDDAAVIRQMASLATPMSPRVAVTLGLPDRPQNEAAAVDQLASELDVSPVSR